MLISPAIMQISSLPRGRRERAVTLYLFGSQETLNLLGWAMNLELSIVQIGCMSFGYITRIFYSTLINLAPLAIKRGLFKKFAIFAIANEINMFL